MDWCAVIGNLIEDWSDRVPPTHYTYAGGVPWEVIFKLANTLAKDAWINIPAHGAATVDTFSP